MSDTRKELVLELEHLLAHAKPGATKRALVERLITRARSGEFHDFKSPHTFPKIVLAGELRAAALAPLAVRVEEGEFDEPPDDADRAELARILREDV